MSNIFDADISKFGNQNRKDCLDLFPTSDKLMEDDYHQSNREDVKTSPGYLYQGTAVFKEQQSKGDFLCQTAYSGNLLDVAYAKCMSTTMRKHHGVLMYDNNGLLQGDYLLDGKFPAAESFYDNIPFYSTSSSHGIKFNKVDAGVIYESFESDFLYGCHGFGYDVEIGGDFQKPFLKRCSTQEGPILHEKSLLVNDEDELQTDSFWSKQNLGEDCHSGKDLCARPCPEVAKKLKMSEDSDFLLRAWSEENCLPSDSCYSAAQTGSLWCDDWLSNSKWHPVYQEPSSQATALGVYHTNDINDLDGVSKCYKRVHCTQIFDDEENRCNFHYNVSRNANQHHCTSSFANSGFNFDGAVDSSEIFNGLVDWPDFRDMYSTKKSGILNDEPGWLLPESCVRNCKRPNINKGKRDHFWHPALEKNHKRSKRSLSAPPFHRSKRRFFSLNQPPETIAKRPTGQASNPAFNPLGFSFSYFVFTPFALFF